MKPIIFAISSRRARRIAVRSLALCALLCVGCSAASESKEATQSQAQTMPPPAASAGEPGGTETQLQPNGTTAESPAGPAISADSSASGAAVKTPSPPASPAGSAISTGSSASGAAVKTPASPAGSAMQTDAAPPAAPAAPQGQLSESASANASKPIQRDFSIPVLNYHSIDVNPNNNAVLDPAKLEQQLIYLKEEGYTPLTLQQFLDIWDGKTEAPPKPVLLTFDDGYADNHTNAMPLLTKYGFPATLFATMGMTGQDGYFADWEQLRELRDNGWDIQPHGMTHPYFNKLKPDQQRFELTESIRLIQEELGIETIAFCYPYGVYNADTLRILEELGVRLAFTIDQGRAEPDQSPLKIKRIFVGGKESMDTFKKKLR